MDYKAQTTILKDSLGLELEPVAVKFSIENKEREESPDIQICSALKEAANGQGFVISPDNSQCPGGTWHCGLGQPPAADRKRRIQRFLTKGEKLYHSITAFERVLTLNTPPPTGLADQIIIKPLVDMDTRPDIIVFLANPEVGCRLLHLDSYWDGIPPKIKPTGAMCQAVISYSIMSGQTNISMGDWTARHHHGFPSELMFITIPYERIDNLIKAIPHCSAGKADVVFPDEL